MLGPLKILHLEDNKLDAELVSATLASEGLIFEITRVETGKDFRTAIDREAFHLVLSDFNLPSFDGFAALDIVKEKCPATPFIFVSGTIGEDLAIETLKKGATDYVLKSRLARLTHSVRRALAEADEKKERERIELQFLQAQKMEAFGQLAAGIAHDFNNLLTVINGFTELRLKALKPAEPGIADLEEILKAGHRATALVRQLLTFSRRQVFEPKVIDLNELVLSLDKMLRRLMPTSIEIVTLLEPKLRPVKADPGQLEQVFLNLAVNASHAMPNGGKLVIETKPSGGDVSFSVSDTGTGMTPEVRARIFEPFFTTKEAGKGTGLGLATVYGIVKQSGGRIEVASEPGKGSNFTVYIPGVDGPLSEERSAGDGDGAPGGRETVLIVDDDASLRNFMCRILKQHGYDILEAMDGEEAIRRVGEHPLGKIRLLVIDIVMPRMGGEEAVRQLRVKHPRLKIIYTSGYMESTQEFVDSLSEETAFLQKPFSAEQLLKKIRQVLDGAAKKKC